MGGTKESQGRVPALFEDSLEKVSVLIINRDHSKQWRGFQQPRTGDHLKVKHNDRERYLVIKISQKIAWEFEVVDLKLKKSE